LIFSSNRTDAIHIGKCNQQSEKKRGKTIENDRFKATEKKRKRKDRGEEMRILLLNMVDSFLSYCLAEKQNIHI